MKTTISVILIVIAFVAAFKIRAMLKARAHIRSRAGRADVRDAIEAESNVMESAVWFRTTELGEHAERELLRYIRRERGESAFDHSAIKAADLRYLGVFGQDENIAHYWSHDEAGGLTYAAITVVQGKLNYDYGVPAPVEVQRVSRQ